MARHFLTIVLTLCLFGFITEAANPVFGAYTSSSCDACLDQTYLSCPGYYQDVAYGTCMCYGDGSTNVAQCLPSCDPGLNEPTNVVATWYEYCVIFFKDMCPAASEYISQSRFNDECSPEAIAAGGLGDSSNTTSNADNESSESATISTAAAGESGFSTNATGTATTTGTKTESTGSSSGGTSSESTSKASICPIPALAVLTGLGMQLVVSMLF